MRVYVYMYVCACTYIYEYGYVCVQIFMYQHIDIYAVHLLCIYDEKISMYVCICK